MIVPDSVLVEAARFAPRVVPLRRDNGRIWWMPLAEARKTAATVRGLWRADVLRSRGGIAVVMVRRDLSVSRTPPRHPSMKPVPRDWTRPQRCVDCNRLMRNGKTRKEEFPDTVPHAKGGKCHTCYGRERRQK